MDALVRRGCEYRLGLVLLLAVGASAPQAQETAAAGEGYPYRAAGDSASARIAGLRAQIAELGPEATEAFWRAIEDEGAPLIEKIPGDAAHSRVTFLWRGSAEARNVVITDGVSIGVGGADPLNSRMTHIAGSDVWYRSYDVRNDGRFTYALSENDPLALFTDPARSSSSVPDPLNSHRLPVIGQTYVELAAADPQPWIEPLEPPLAGQVEQQDLNGRALRIYTPAGFDRAAAAYPLVVTLAGGFYADMVAVVPTLDHLIAARRLPPVVAVAVSGTADELQCSPAFAKYLADVLVPWMRQNYRVTDDPARTVVAGSSLGGLAASFAALTHADVFGNVLSQSGSYWWNRKYGSREEGDDFAEAEWLTERIGMMERVDVRFYVEVGRMEFEGQLGTNRRFRDALLGKGYAVDYREFNGNHSYVNWRGSFGTGLLSLLSTR